MDVATPGPYDQGNETLRACINGGTPPGKGYVDAPKEAGIRLTVICDGTLASMRIVEVETSTPLLDVVAFHYWRDRDGRVYLNSTVVIEDAPGSAIPFVGPFIDGSGPTLEASATDIAVGDDEWDRFVDECLETHGIDGEDRVWTDIIDRAVIAPIFVPQAMLV